MSEFRRPRPEDTFIWPDSTWASSYRAMLADQAYAKAWELFHETDSGSRVIGGFRATETPALTTRIERGMALVYDAASVAPAPKWKVVFNPGNITGTHVAHEGTHRIDVVSLSYAMVADSSQSLGRVGGGMPASTNTEIGCVCTVVVTKGTAGGTNPTVPATPAGNLKLWEVYVPATSGALVYIDARQYAPGSRNRRIDDPVSVHSDADTLFATNSRAALFEVHVRATGAGTMDADKLVDYESDVQFDIAEDWLRINRQRAEAGDKVGGMYPLMAPARTWWRSVPFWGGDREESSTANLVFSRSDVGGLRLLRATNGSSTASVYVGIPAEARALELVAAELRYKTTQAFDATVGGGGRVFKLIHMAADGTATELVSQNVTIASLVDACATPVVLSLASTPVLAKGDTLVARFTLELTASGTNNLGDLELHGIDLQFKEGRA